MSVPDLSSSATALRADGHEVDVYFGVFRGDTIVTLAVSGTPTYPATAIAVTVSSGDWTAVEAGMRVEHYASNGTTLKSADLRVATVGMTANTSLPVNEFSANHADVVSGDVLKVINEYAFQPKLVGNDENFLPDSRQTYTDQTSALAPIPNSGGHHMGFVDDGETFRTVAFDGSGSFALDPDSGGTLTHSWAFGSGASPTTSTSESPSGVEFNVGFHAVRHTVTDSSNSKTWTQVVYVKVYDRSSNMPYVPTDISITRRRDSGASAQVTLRDSATIANVPDYAMCAVFVEETINGSANASIGSDTGDPAIKCLGFLWRDRSRVGNGFGELTFEIVSPLFVLRNKVAFSKVFDKVTTASNWQEFDDVTFRVGIFHTLQYYTSVIDLMDVQANFTDVTYTPGFLVYGRTPYEQMHELADGIDCEITGTWDGRILIQDDPVLLTEAQRSALTTTFTLTASDAKMWNPRRNHQEGIRWLRGDGFDTSGNPLFAQYPSSTPGDGHQDITVSRLVVTNQADLNTRIGDRGAKANAVYVDSNGGKHRFKGLSLDTFGSYDCLDFYKGWIEIDPTDITDLRGTGLSNWRFLLAGTQVRYRNGTAFVTHELLAETGGEDAETYTPPNDLFDFGTITPTSLVLPTIGFDTSLLQGDSGFFAQEVAFHEDQASRWVKLVTNGGIAGLGDNAPTTTFDGSGSDYFCGAIWELVSTLCHYALQTIQNSNSLSIAKSSAITNLNGERRYMHGGKLKMTDVLNDVSLNTSQIIAALQDATAVENLACEIRDDIRSDSIGDGSEISAGYASFQASPGNATTTTQNEEIIQSILDESFTQYSNYLFLLKLVDVYANEGGAPSCPTCATVWCRTFDFTGTQARGFVVQGSEGQIGANGWEANDSGTGTAQKLHILYTVPSDITVTSAVAVYSASDVSGVDSSFIVQIDNANIINLTCPSECFAEGTDRDITGTHSGLTGTDIEVDIDTGASGATFTLHSLELNGTSTFSGSEGTAC